MKSRTIALAIASVIVLTVSILSVSAQDHPAAMGSNTSNTHLTRAEVKALIANAKTPKDHLQLAAYFRNEAQEAEMMAENHEAMMTGYEANPIAGTTTELEMHCKEFTDMARKAAAADQEMAKEHEAIAARLQQNK